MNKTLLSVLALLVFACSGMAQTLPSYVPTNGLVGWWPFNGNANDESGNGNNGITNQMVWGSDRFGNPNSAAEYHGNYQRAIRIPNPDGATGGEFTFSFWLKASGPLSIYNAIIDAKGSGMYCQMYGPLSQYVNAGVYGKLGFSGYLGYNESSSTVNDSLWHHGVMVVNWTGGNLKIYVDGIINATRTFSPQNITPWTAIDFGNGYDQINNPNNEGIFGGSLDDIAIYNRALTQQEITGLYQGANTTSNCPTFPASLAQGLVGYWPFCGNALDKSGNNNHGTVNGAMLTTDRFGNINAAYRFPTPLSNISTLSWFSNIKQTYTLSSWIYLTDSSFNVNAGDTVMTVLLHRAHNNDKAIFLYAPNLINYRDNLGNQGTLVPTVNLTNNWSHITFTSTNDSLALFLNGLLIKKTPRVNTSNWTTNYHGSFFGGNSFDNNWSTNFHGSLDDIAIWNRALTPQEITQLYNQGICQTSITVTDTLLIHTGITSYNPVAFGNTIKVWPNPGNTAITLDAGNLASMQGWKYKVANGLGQTVVNETAISQQQTNISLSTWGGNGIYYLHLINPQGIAVEIKKIVLAP